MARRVDELRGSSKVRNLDFRALRQIKPMMRQPLRLVQRVDTTARTDETIAALRAKLVEAEQKGDAGVAALEDSLRSLGDPAWWLDGGAAKMTSKKKGNGLARAKQQDVTCVAFDRRGGAGPHLIAAGTDSGDVYVYCQVRLAGGAQGPTVVPASRARS